MPRMRHGLPGPDPGAGALGQPRRVHQDPQRDVLQERRDLVPKHGRLRVGAPPDPALVLRLGPPDGRAPAPRAITRRSRAWPTGRSAGSARTR